MKEPVPKMLGAIPASATLNSNALFKAAKELTTRPQYMYVANSSDAGSEMVPIVKACRVEEENKHRLELAGLVLASAFQLLTWETSSEEHRRSLVDGILPGPPGGIAH